MNSKIIARIVLERIVCGSFQGRSKKDEIIGWGGGEKWKRERKEGERVILKNLTAPLKMGPFELENRMVLAPMNETMSGVNGEATEQAIAYYAARAKGGCAMVITGAIMGTRMGSQFVWGRNLHCFHPGHLQGLGMLTKHIHHFGAVACAQMSMGFGRQGYSCSDSKVVFGFYGVAEPNGGISPVSPIILLPTQLFTRELTW